MSAGYLRAVSTIALGLLVVPLAWAQEATVRVRGTIERVDGDTYFVKARDGSTTASGDGQVLTLKYKDGEKQIVVPAGTPIVSYVPGDVNELKAGARIFISAAKKLPDGSLEAARVNVALPRRCNHCWRSRIVGHRLLPARSG